MILAMAAPRDMAAPTRTRATTPGVRRRVIEAALHAFSTEGYDAVSIEMVREAADVSVGSLYHHFESKAGVASAVFAEAIDRYHRPLLDVLATNPPAEYGVRSLVGAHHRWVAGHADWAAFMVTMGDLAEIRVDAARRDVVNAHLFDALRGWAQPLMDAGTLRPLEPRVFSSVLFGPSYFHTRLSLIGSAGPPDPGVTEPFADAAWHSLAGPAVGLDHRSEQGA